jgi:hypothetical protein
VTNFIKVLLHLLERLLLVTTLATMGATPTALLKTAYAFGSVRGLTVKVGKANFPSTEVLGKFAISSFLVGAEGLEPPTLSV